MSDIEHHRASLKNARRNNDFDLANKILAEATGMDFFRYISIDNCPSEKELTAAWNPLKSKVSILLITYNHDLYLEAALCGIFNQITDHEFEVIVRDDASQDETQSIIEKWRGKYSRIIKCEFNNFNQYSEGISPLRASLELARNQYIAICEGDDFWINPKKIQSQADILDKYNRLSVALDNHIILNESDFSVKFHESSLRHYMISPIDLMCVNRLAWVHSAMFRNGLFKFPAYDVRKPIGGDYILTSMLGNFGEGFFNGKVFGSVSRKNLTSLFNPMSESDKNKLRINSREFLAEFYSSRGLNHVANHHKKVIKEIIKRQRTYLTPQENK